MANSELKQAPAAHRPGRAGRKRANDAPPAPAPPAPVHDAGADVEPVEVDEVERADPGTLPGASNLKVFTAWVNERWRLLSEATKAVPFVKYAMALAAVAAAMSIILAFAKADPVIAAIGMPSMLLLMVAMYTLTKLVEQSPGDFRTPLRLLVWTAALCVASTPVLALTSLFIGQPLDWRRTTPQMSPAEQKVIEYKNEVVNLRGDFEALDHNPGAYKRVRDEGVRLAGLLSNYESASLDLARRILLYEYKGWALSMAARTYVGASDEDRRARVKYAADAIDALEQAVRLMKGAEDGSRGGDPALIKVHDWVHSSDSKDFCRVQYQLAVSKAAARSAGSDAYSKAEIAEHVAKVRAECPSYLAEYPSDYLKGY